MALALVNYTHDGFQGLNAYAKITGLTLYTLPKGMITILLSVWPSRDLAESGAAPAAGPVFVVTGDLYTTILGAAQPGADGNVPATEGERIMVNAYYALAQLPEAQTLLAGATPAPE